MMTPLMTKLDYCVFRTIELTARMTSLKATMDKSSDLVHRAWIKAELEASMSQHDAVMRLGDQIAATLSQMAQADAIAAGAVPDKQPA